MVESPHGLSTVRNDWNWSDRFIPAIRSIVGPELLAPASLDVDRNMATDLVVLHARDVLIACRVRRAEYNRAEYSNQFTIRCKRDSGSKTELNKIISGWGDWLLYGFEASDKSPTLDAWHLIDLTAFRTHLIQNPEQIVTGVVPNGDGTYFRWFDLKSFPSDPAILISSNHKDFRISEIRTAAKQRYKEQSR